MIKGKNIRKNKKAQTVKVIVMLIVGLVVVGIMIFLGYKYILGTGKSIGGLGSCEGQGGDCKAKGACTQIEEQFYGMGCPGPDDNEDDKYCCIPKGRLEG